MVENDIGSSRLLFVQWNKKKKNPKENGENHCSYSKPEFYISFSFPQILNYLCLSKKYFLLSLAV